MADLSKAFSGFSTDDVPAAMAFYADALGLDVTEENGMLFLHSRRPRRAGLPEGSGAHARRPTRC